MQFFVRAICGSFIFLFSSFLIFSRNADVAEDFGDSGTGRPKITVFVHGTLPKFTDHIIHKLDVPWGLCPMTLDSSSRMMGRIGRIMHRADSENFPIEHSYTFGWSGHLSFLARRVEGRILYHILRTLDGDITLIGHSHGGNIGLEVARAAELEGDTTFRIKRLVLFAAPCQVATARFVASPVFEEVISIVSYGDDTQLLDPQGIYRESRILRREGYEVPMFSERYFPDAPQLVQMRILYKKWNPGHLHFIGPSIVRHWPALIKYAATLPHNGARYTVNIDADGVIKQVWKRVSCTGRIRYIDCED